MESPSTLGEILKAWKSKGGNKEDQNRNEEPNKKKLAKSDAGKQNASQRSETPLNKCQRRGNEEKEMEWEKKLAMEIANKLHIKRRREEPSMLMIESSGRQEHQNKEDNKKKARLDRGKIEANAALLNGK
ncbi:hypothetical protein PIB30_068837 [Stylosanthes scabra]|uniref:Uncharacterized protein n=1 Tax=Stylosanthes scabra TaxID=79078 RepID=A0ABU6XKU0_9FABA|nr:hypothetical protein [Stylosanthes scabra]